MQTPATRPGRNGGTLLAGGQIGNKGGPGRIPSEVAKVCLERFENRIARLDAIAGDELVGRTGRRKNVPISEQRHAILALGRMGGMAQHIDLDAGGTTLVEVLLGPKAAELAKRRNPEPEAP